jgi:hypothetical protein
VWAVTHGGSVYRYDGNSATLDDGNSDEVFVGRFDLVTHLSTFETYDLWAGGGQVFVAGRPPWRFDGTQWSQIPVAAMPPRGTYSVYGAGVGDVSMTMDSGVVIDAFTNAARIDRFDGTSWTTDSVPPLTRPLRRVRGIPGGLRVAVGDAGTILHRKQAVSAAK